VRGWSMDLESMQADVGFILDGLCQAKRLVGTD
jgi:hypothetical protein